jgi:hypothetical protein
MHHLGRRASTEETMAMESNGCGLCNGHPSGRYFWRRLSHELSSVEMTDIRSAILMLGRAH